MANQQQTAEVTVTLRYLCECVEGEPLCVACDLLKPGDGKVLGVVSVYVEMRAFSPLFLTVLRP